jgi:epoxyqueuosine reductase
MMRSMLNLTSNPMGTDPFTLAREVKRVAIDAGFDLVGITPAGPSAYGAYLRDWLDAGRAGSMAWMHDRFEMRVDPTRYLPGARSVVCVALNYNVATDRAAPGDSTEQNSVSAHVARYALGVDYHEHVKPRLYQIADWLRDRVPGTRTLCGVDTVPVLERELAARAGVGWVGKNTCVINEQIGSWIFLGEVLTTLDLAPDAPAVDRCGTCTRCIDACPTGAIDQPYQLDATRCISYLTIEHVGDVRADLSSKLSGWLYGCDICQDVCPWNRRAPASSHEACRAIVPATHDAHDVLNWTEGDYHRATRHTAMRRVKLPVFQRTARHLLGR